MPLLSLRYHPDICSHAPCTRLSTRSFPPVSGLCNIDGSCDTFTHMKTTVELPDKLLREAKRVALRERQTVRALIERGLRTVIGGRRPGGQFVLRKAGFRGDGLVTGRSLRDWETIRDLGYSERGA